MEIKYEVLFLEASDEVLIKRYKETRRSHPPWPGGGRVDDGIRRGAGEAGLPEEEGGLLWWTPAGCSPGSCGRSCTRSLWRTEDYKNLYITVLSFGFKYGLPKRCGSGV